LIAVAICAKIQDKVKIRRQRRNNLVTSIGQ
jgi:hypothetical protein